MQNIPCLNIYRRYYGSGKRRGCSDVMSPKSSDVTDPKGKEVGYSENLWILNVSYRTSESGACVGPKRIEAGY